MGMSEPLQYVPQEEFDRLCAAMKARQEAVRRGFKQLHKAQTMQEVIDARRAIKAAQNIVVESQDVS